MFNFVAFWGQSFEIDCKLVCPCSSLWFTPEEAPLTYMNIIVNIYNSSIATGFKKKETKHDPWLKEFGMSPKALIFTFLSL